MRRMFALLLMVLGASPTCPSVNINTDVVKGSVVYIYGGNQEGRQEDPNNAIGTGFLVRIPLTLKPNASYHVLVTARHVFDPTWAHCATTNPQWLYLRMNTKAYDAQKDGSGIGFVPVQLIAGETWVHPKDDNVDAAVLTLNPKAFEKYDFGGISLSDFATEEEVKQRKISDPVLSAGLLPVFPGARRNYPVFKFGNISAQPDELVSVPPCIAGREATMVKLWLLSINLIAGNSGSPIFYVPEGANNSSFGGGRPALLGVQSISIAGADISGMTPIQYVYEAISEMKLPNADLYRGSIPKPN